MEKLENHERFYDEHASQARMHEEQRERVTNIILSIAGVLVGLVTFAKLSYWALPAALSVIILGGYGYLFSGRHYERNRFHTKVMSKVRDEIDRVQGDENAIPEPLSTLRCRAGKEHYREFVWPSFSGSRDKEQSGAKSWIARQRLHIFWELVHLIIAALGLALCLAIVLNERLGEKDKPMKVDVRNWGMPSPAPDGKPKPTIPPALH
jgi:hypothetical protein